MEGPVYCVGKVGMFCFVSVFYLKFCERQFVQKAGNVLFLYRYFHYCRLTDSSFI